MRIMDELIKELNTRGTAEISNGVVTQVTQALDETDTHVDYLLFGELKHSPIIPIEQACAKCDFWLGKYNSTSECQVSQKEDAEARGFHKMICPNQFV